MKLVVGKRDGDVRERSPGEVRGVRLQNPAKVDQPGLSSGRLEPAGTVLDRPHAVGVTGRQHHDKARGQDHG